MRNSLVVPLAIAIGCGTVAAVGVTHAVRNSNAAPTEARMVEIFVAVRDMDIGEQILPEMVRLEKWPADRSPLDGTNDLKKLEGKYLNQRLYAGEPLLLKKVNESGDSAASRIPPGFRAVTLDLKGEPGLAYLIQPGHRADVMGFFEKSDIVPETTLKTVLSDVRVFAVDGVTIRREEKEGVRKPAKTVSLLIQEEDQEAWTWAQQLSTLKISLRNDRDSSSQQEEDLSTGPNVAGQEFLNWIKDKEKKMVKTVAPLMMPSLPPVTPKKPADGPKMEIWTPDGLQVWEWKDGSSTPTLVSTDQATGRGAPPDLSFLNGVQSPLFAPLSPVPAAPAAPPPAPATVEE